MACLWDSTLYVESHYPAFNPRLKCPECSDRGALRVLQKTDRTVATPTVVAPPVAVTVALVVAPLAVAGIPADARSPTLLGVAPPMAVAPLSVLVVVAALPPLVAPPELHPVVLSRPWLCPSLAPTMALHH